MAHAKCVITNGINVGIPQELVDIIAKYAELSGDERLEMMLGVKRIVAVDTFNNDDIDIFRTLCIQETRHGIEVTSTLTGDSRERINRECFIKAMCDGSIEFVIENDVMSCSPRQGHATFRYLRQNLIDHWLSI